MTAKPPVCTCGHPLGEHLGDVHLITTRCQHAHCGCKRYDARNWSDAELAHHRLEELEQHRRQVQGARTDPAPAQPPPSPAAAALDRIAVALEGIAAELEVLARPVRNENPCPKGGFHKFVHQVAERPGEAPVMDCSRCGAHWAETEPP